MGICHIPFHDPNQGHLLAMIEDTTLKGTAPTTIDMLMFKGLFATTKDSL